MTKNEEARKVLISSFGNEKNLKLPGDVGFILEENKTQCRIKLNPKKVQTKNMQIDVNAFEAWAVALHIAMEKPGKIILDVDGTFENIAYETNGHWGRFLYRALRFSQQYEWFELSGQVKAAVEKFKEYLSHHYFTNNLAKGEAGIKEKHGDENVVEAKFAEKGVLQSVLEGAIEIGNNEVYRQLPVGLFRITEDVTAENKTYKYSNKTNVFTGRKSAMDLWTWNEDTFEVIELKTKNPMMGIISEIFFYSNYMYDFLVREDRRFVLNRPKKETGNDRGYSNISADKFKKICGIMLADKYHPILEKKEVLDVLNLNVGVDIKYEKKHYEYVVDISRKNN